MKTEEQKSAIVEHLRVHQMIDAIIATRGTPAFAAMSSEERESMAAEQRGLAQRASVLEQQLYADSPQYHPATEEDLAGQPEDLVAFWRKRFAKK